MEITHLVAEFVELSRQTKSGPLPAEEQRRWQELKTLLLVAQQQPSVSASSGFGLETGLETGLDDRTRR